MKGSIHPFFFELRFRRTFQLALYYGYFKKKKREIRINRKGERQGEGQNIER